MKKISCLIASFCLAFNIFNYYIAICQNEVKSKLESVTIYPAKALVEKSAVVNLVRGENNFIITNNATPLSAENIHFSAGEGFFITNINTKTINQSFLQAAKSTLQPSVYTQVSDLYSQIEKTKSQIKDNNVLINTYKQQMTALQNMKTIKNTQIVDSVSVMRQQFDFQRKESLTISNLIDNKTKENAELNIKVQKLENNLETLIKKNNYGCNISTKSNNILITIFSNKNATTELNYNYLVSNVQSIYSYDIMLNEEKGNAIFNLKNTICQNSGYNWANCKIIFSTNDADFAGSEGNLPIWYLDLNQYQPRVYKEARRNNTVMFAKSLQTDMLAEEESSEEDMSIIGSVASAESLSLSKEFTLNTSQSITSGGEWHNIPLVSDTTKAIFRHFSTPKNVEKVFYAAMLPDWEDLSLLDVKSNIFLNNKYLSKTYLQTSEAKDTLHFAAGEDKDVKITRKVSRTSPDKGFLSSSVTETVTVNLNITNTKNKKITLNLKDQVPISQNADIKVLDISAPNCEINSSTGIINWNLDLEAKQTKQISFSYTVKYPKDSQLYLN